MRLQLQFNVDNASYRDATNALLCDEVANTLRGAAEIIEKHGTLNEPLIEDATWLIVDPNGNTVGRWTFVDDSSAAIKDTDVVMRCLQQANRNLGQQNRKVVTDND